MKVTVKGQVTIPQALRKRYGFTPGAEVEFVAGPEGVQLRARRKRRRAASRFDVWLSKATGSATSHMTTDELMSLTRDTRRSECPDNATFD